MNKRLAASALAAVSTASVLSVVSAAPAEAATPCGTYPPGLAYVLVRAPGSGTVHAGTILGTRGTLRRGGQACVGFTLGFYFKASPAEGYRNRAHGPTDSTGSFRAKAQINANSRFYYNLTISTTKSVRSAASQILVG